ncbi:MAG: hypothetical protein WC713_04375 [Candidatus Methylomirabilota bacterium]
MTSARRPSAGPAGESWRRFAPAGAAALALALAVLCGLRLDAAGRSGAAAAPILFPRVALLRPALLGFESLAADYWWLRTVQYFGDRMEREERFPQLYQLVDMTVSLDPHFLDAYRYGGLFLVIAKQFPQAIQIYTRGIARRPEDWQLPHDLGRLYFLELQDSAQALRWWTIADRLPGRPHYLPRFIARLTAETGALETALELWHEMAETSDNPWVRQNARREIARILDTLRRGARGGGLRR